MIKSACLPRSVTKSLKVPSLARSVQKPLKVPIVACSVPKNLKVPSFALSLPKPLKFPSLVRSVPKPLLIVPRCRPPPPAEKERSDWLWSESEWMIHFWSFIFPETNICYISCIYLFCYMKEKVHNNYLMGFIFSTSWRVALTKIKFFMGIWIFQKRFQK